MKFYKMIIANLLIVAVFFSFCGAKSFCSEVFQSKYIVVLGYEIRNLEDTTYVHSIQPGEDILVKVHLTDPRLNVQAFENINVKVISKSFQVLGNEFVDEGVYAVKNGLAFTVFFRVKYSGVGDKLLFEYSYNGENSILEKDTIEVHIPECRPTQFPEEESSQSEIESETVVESESESESETQSDTNFPESNTELPPPNSGIIDGAGSANMNDATSNSDRIIRTSQFLIQSVDYDSETIKAGEDFTCRITVMASQGEERIQNALITLTLPRGFSFTDSSDRVYLGELRPGYTYDAEFNLHASDDLSKSEYVMTANMTGVSSYYGIPLDAESDITLTLSATAHLEISNMIVPQQINSAYDDGSGLTQFLLTNSGGADAKEIQITIEGDSFESSDAYVIDLLKVSENHMVNLNLIAKKEGDLAGSIRISYKNNDDEIKIIDRPIQVKAEYHKAEINHTVSINPENIKEEPLIPDWVWAIIWLGAFIGAFLLVKGVFSYIHKITISKEMD